MEKTSMLYWWPKIRGLAIPVPRTEIVEIPYNRLVSMLDGKRLPDKYQRAIAKAASHFNFPIFLRTDMGSAKHHWERTCFVPEMEELLRHIWCLIDETLAAGMFGELDPNALVLREYIPLYSRFSAFSGLPIARERRYFIRDGNVECHHPYWIEDAIEKSWRQPTEDNWKDILANFINDENPTETQLLTAYADKVASVLDGYWSVDFACSVNKVWYLIDMAEGEKSWHPECSGIKQMTIEITEKQFGREDGS